MRILPLALVERDSTDEQLIDHAHRASRVTHGHPRCQVACALYSLIVRGLLIGGTDRAAVLARALARLREAYRAPGLAAHLAALDELEAWTDRSGRGFVLDSFWSAWDAFADAGSYQDAVVQAVKYGRDTNTTAAIAGGLAGAMWGVDAIPADWIGGLRDRPIVVPLVDQLVGTAGWKTSTASPLRVDLVEIRGAVDLAAHRGHCRDHLPTGQALRGCLDGQPLARPVD
jgi:ADP-ribosyl-[dinitrogen reductase] hydrolase